METNNNKTYYYCTILHLHDKMNCYALVGNSKEYYFTGYAFKNYARLGKFLIDANLLLFETIEDYNKLDKKDLIPKGFQCSLHEITEEELIGFSYNIYK